MAPFGVDLMDMGLVISLLSIAIVIMVQTITVIWFFAKLDARIGALETYTLDVKDHPTRIAKFEVMLEVIQRQQDEQIIAQREQGKKIDQVLANQAARRSTANAS